MTKNTATPTPLLKVTIREINVSHQGEVYQTESYIEHRTLIQALTIVRDLAHEPHTRKNLQTVLNSIRDLKPTL